MSDDDMINMIIGNMTEVKDRLFLELSDDDVLSDLKDAKQMLDELLKRLEKPCKSM